MSGDPREFLGPLLFSVFIRIECTLTKIADTKLSSAAVTTEGKNTTQRDPDSLGSEPTRIY